jgi:NADH-quinone oxidoreductase subunit E
VGDFTENYVCIPGRVDISMTRLLEKISETDPLQIADKRAVVDQIIDEYKNTPGSTMLVLNELQSQIGYITPAMQAYTAERLKVPLGTIHGVVTFYSFFTTQPRGKHTVKFCMGTACYVGGMQQLIDKAKQVTGTDVGSTTEDGAITLEVCRCVGACSQAPVIVVDEEVLGRVKPNKFPQVLRKLQD